MAELGPAWLLAADQNPNRNLTLGAFRNSSDD
jgi:hypothetical protein